MPALRVALIIGAIALLGLLAWQLTHVLLLVFAAVLIAVLLRSLAGVFERISWLKPPWSVLLAALLIASVLAGFAVLLGSQVQTQITDLADELPGRIDALGERFGVSDLREQLTSRAEDMGAAGGIFGQTASYTFAVLDAAATLLIVVVAGIFIALKPAMHLNGALMLFPNGPRARARTALNTGGRALQLWLLGQLASMVMVGVLTGIGLSIIGVPSSIGLGFLAGLFEFVPVFGPIAAAVPAILLALSEGGTTALWTILLFVVIQQLEGNIIQPLIQRRAVDLPPVLMLFSILAFGVLFGVLGVILATPLAVLTYVLIKQLYLRDVLKEDVDVPGDG
jgi:predicted PurR-regulated permease PerM